MVGRSAGRSVGRVGSVGESQNKANSDPQQSFTKMGYCGSSSKRIEDLQDEKIQENQSITEIGIINLGQNDENNNTNHFFKINVLEIIIAIILFIGLIFGIYKLYKHWKQKELIQDWQKQPDSKMP